jgi:hypothetical protein
MQQVSIHGTGLAALLLLFGAPSAHAVTSMEQIDRLAAINAALLDFRVVATPGPRAKGLIEIGVEIAPVPHIDNTIGAKYEPVNPPPAGAKLRVNWSPVSGLRLGGYWIPPVTVMQITANMAGAEAEYGWKWSAAKNNFVGSVRLFGSTGTVTGPFTAPDVQDKFKLSSAGADLRLGVVTGPPVNWNWASGVWTWYGGAGAGGNRTQFNLALDGALIDGQRAYRFAYAGVGWSRGPWSFVAEQHRTENYLNHILFKVNYAY